MKTATDNKRLHFTLPGPLLEKIRKEAYVQKTQKGKVVRIALEEYFNRKK